jgi:hypothetical protein
MTFTNILSRAMLAVAVTFAVGQSASSQTSSPAIDLDKQQVQLDQQQVDQDKADLQKLQQQSADYQKQVQNAEAARPGVEAQLRGLKQRGHFTTAQLQKMLSTPGNELYVLNTWLVQEQAMKTQSDKYMQALQARIQQALAKLQQDQYNRDMDKFKLSHDSGLQQEQNVQNADQQREEKDAQYWTHRDGQDEVTDPSEDPNWVYGAAGTGWYQPFNPFLPYKKPKHLLSPLYTPAAESGTTAGATGPEPVVLY